jgi:D-lactate dehydrogenase
LRSENVAQHADADIISTFIFSELDSGGLEKLPSLELIATRSTGFDHIDTDYCTARGITVSNVPRYGENTVAEHVFALLLAISHRLPEAIDRAQRGHFSPDGLQGFDLAGKTIGVIGAGNIGRHVIRIANDFQMDVLAFDARGLARLSLRRSRGPL